MLARWIASLCALISALAPACPAHGAGGQVVTAGIAATDADWAVLGRLQPVRSERSIAIIGRSFGVDPTNPARFAYCQTGAIELTEDGGGSFLTVPTDAIAPLAVRLGYPLLAKDSNAPPCTSVALDPNSATSIYAMFQSSLAPYGAPPIVNVGYVTSDLGQTWSAVPVPDNLTMQNFGGFSSQTEGVDALWAAPSPAQGDLPGFEVEQTTDGGATWALAQPDCPSVGPCVRWGPAPNMLGSCNMAARPQAVWFSPDQGQSWSRSPVSARAGAPLDAGVNGCDLNELVVLDSGGVLLISAASELTPPSTANGIGSLQFTADGGLSWREVQFPPPSSRAGRMDGWQMLPDGALIGLATEDKSWLRLDPGAASWCPLPALPVSSVGAARTAQVIGDGLWWLDDTSGSADAERTDHAARSVPLSDLVCS